MRHMQSFGSEAKWKSTKRKNILSEIDFDEISFEAEEREKKAHQFEDLSRRIIGAALEVQVL